MPGYSNGHSSVQPPIHEPEHAGVDPAILLLVGEIRRGQDSLRGEMVAAQRENTAALGSVVTELRELRRQAPGRFVFSLSSALVVISLVSIFGLLASRGVDVGAVADAARTLTTVTTTSGAPSTTTTETTSTTPTTPAATPTEP
ncbi:MAG: hypothetical protein Q8P18_33165 [Pseudomonadota bacterium]|nr:hypothetical protein [Pseudomonadota bacterium]